MTDFITMQCLKTGKFYPDYNSREGELRYCAEGDIIHVHPEDISHLMDAGLVKPYDYEVKL